MAAIVINFNNAYAPTQDVVTDPASVRFTQNIRAAFARMSAPPAPLAPMHTESGRVSTEVALSSSFGF